MKMMLSEIAKVTNGTHVGSDVEVASASIDTRAIQSGDLYIAIKGHQFDGNEFVDKAERSGAAAAILNKNFTSKLPHVLVDDTRLALAQLAGAWRDNVTAKVVGITGSNGKTTVKEMTAAVLGVAGSVLFTKGNLNNDIGVPLTLFRLNEDHRYAVIEMGANHLGEIAYTSAIAKSDVVILNNAGAAHIEGFGSLDGIAKGKGEIIETLKAEGVAILNKDDKYFEYWLSIAGNRKVLSFGLLEGADITARNIQTDIIDNAFATTFDLMASSASVKVKLKLAGQHNVLNALAATAAGLALDLSLEQIKAGLESVKPVTGRMQPLVGRLGNIIIDDTYNANADSLKVGLEVLANCKGKHWVVLGAFGELGPESPRIHEEIGKLISSKGVVRLLALGSDAKNTARVFGKGATFFDSQDELIGTLKKELKGDETILIKGSRTQRMENVAAALVENFRT
ncbi:UDP-N-acetylmuramoyl-tripeptide--D-alanyl-D-alanine ligase [Methyloglobulus sp.]|uniref:UDP-N-acetylmuramoyl-tripeptide--D-alanyl-D- alanine ligase n=1 Tax=Methyloglobulus sp. TaxID=2518622 RepID=UPI0032B8571E